MLANLAAPALAGLLAVTFGWVPSEETADTPEASTEGYDYLVQLAPEDVEALWSGRAMAVTSELPDDVGPISRVRVYVGRGEAPRRLTKIDQQSPRRIAAAAAPRRYEVAKPVAPAWGDAAQIADGADALADEATDNAASAEGTTADASESPSEPQPRTAYQNAPLFNDLPSDFRDAGEKSWQALDEGARDLEESVKNAARGVTDTLDRVNPFGSRPQYPQQAGQGAAPAAYPPGYTPRGYQGGNQGGTPSRVEPPSPVGRSYDARVAQQPSTPPPSTPPLRMPSQNGAGRADEGASILGRGPALPPYGAEDESLVTRFGDEPRSSYGPELDRPVTPIQRGTTSGASQQAPEGAGDGWNDRRSEADRMTDAERRELEYYRRLRELDEGGRERGVAEQDDSDFAPLPSRTAARDAADGLRDSAPPPARPVSDTSWVGSGGGGDVGEFAEADPAAKAPAANRSSDLQTVLMVLALGAAGWVWVTHMELRAKYRALLRSGSGGYASAA
ncbi:hypothetical protein [Botrimarina sp.]|uniref:hypothetical protein n=1 Tax=Botrimarina sp. TaxID=2795802 RepID=UPI0032EE7776